MKTVLIFLAIIMNFTVYAFEDSFTSGVISIQNLDKYKGNYVSLYLVVGSRLFGKNPTVNKVAQSFGTKKIEGDLVIFEKLIINEQNDSFINPNFIVAVVHASALNALNKNPAGNSYFEQPEYAKNIPIVAPSENTIKEISRSSLKIQSVQDLSTDLSIEFPR